MITVVELPEYIRRSENLLNSTERKNLVTYLAAHPSAGVIMEGTGGIRKLRWKRDNIGKSGGVRAIYYFYNEKYPLFLLSIFGKSEKANLSKAERNELAKFVRELIKSYGNNHEQSI